MSVSYNREELWERKVNEEVIKSGDMTTFFRPDERICGENGLEKCFNVGEIISVVVVDSPGYSERSVLVYGENKKHVGERVLAEVLPEFSKTVRKAKIVKLEVLDLKDIEERHFVGSPNIIDRNTLVYTLGLIYDKGLDSFGRITRIEVEYLD